MQYYVNFDEHGNISAFYVDIVHFDAIPDTAIPISVEDWNKYSTDAGRYKLDGEVIREKTVQELPVIVSEQLPTTEDYLLDFEYRLSKIELGV